MGNFLETLPDVSGKQITPAPTSKPTTGQSAGKFLSTLPDVGATQVQAQDKPLGPLLSKLPDAKLQQKVITPTPPPPAPTVGENISNFFKSMPDAFGSVAKGTVNTVDNLVKSIASALGSQVDNTSIKMAPEYIPANNSFVKSKTGESITEEERALLNKNSLGPTQTQQLEDRLKNPIPKPIFNSDLKISQGPQSTIREKLKDTPIYKYLIEPVRDSIGGTNEQTRSQNKAYQDVIDRLTQKQSSGVKLSTYENSVLDLALAERKKFTMDVAENLGKQAAYIIGGEIFGAMMDVPEALIASNGTKPLSKVGSKLIDIAVPNIEDHTVTAQQQIINLDSHLENPHTPSNDLPVIQKMKSELEIKIEKAQSVIDSLKKAKETGIINPNLESTMIDSAKKYLSDKIPAGEVGVPTKPVGESIALARETSSENVPITEQPIDFAKVNAEAGGEYTRPTTQEINTYLKDVPPEQLKNVGNITIDSTPRIESGKEALGSSKINPDTGKIDITLYPSQITNANNYQNTLLHEIQHAGGASEETIRFGNEMAAIKGPETTVPEVTGNKIVPTEQLPQKNIIPKEVSKEVSGSVSDIGKTPKTLENQTAPIKPELQNFASEAKKYKTAEEFSNYYSSNPEKIPTSSEYKQYLSQNDSYVKQENELYQKLKDLRDKYQGKTIKQVSPKDKLEYDRLYSELNKTLSKKTLALVPETPVKTHIGEKTLKTQLTDFYNKVKETPKEQVKPDFNKIAKQAYADFKENGPKISPLTEEEIKTQMQSGFISPGAIAQDAAKTVNDAKQFIEKSNKINEFTGDLDKDLNIIRTSSKADNLIAKEYLKNVNITPADAEAIYHYAEDKKSPITQAQLDIYEKYIKPLRQESDKLFGDLRNEGIPLNREDYTPRFVAGKGGVFEQMKEGGKSIREGGILRKTTGSFKKRVMKALVDENGKRQVVSIKQGLVTAFDNKIAKDLGRLKIKKYQDLIENELKPFEERLKEFQKELATLKSIKTRSPISESRLKDLHEKLAKIHIERALESILEGEKNVFTRQEKNSILTTIKEIKTLESVKKVEDIVLTRERITTLTKKIVSLVNKISDIEGKYPENLDAKVFVDRNGKNWKIVDATTKEIEKNTKLTYHKNILLNELISYTRLKQASRATEFLNKVKESPQFSEFAMKTGEGDIPKGWKPTVMPQFIGYQFDPKIADALDNFAGKMRSGQILKPLTALNTFLRTSIFFNPFLHIPNIVNHAVVARGMYRYALPTSYARAYEASLKAFRDITTLNENYQKMLEGGTNLMYGDTTGQLTDLMVKKMQGEVKANPQIPEQIAKAMGLPLKTIQFIFGRQGLSSKITWFTNDFFTLQAIYERQAEGMSLPDAIKDVGKHIPNYQIPSRIFNSRAISQLMQNPNITMFGAYHYGALKSYGEMIKTLVTGNSGERPMRYNAESGKRTYGEYYNKESFKERAKAVDMLAMMAIIGLFLYPLADKFIKQITGNKKAQLRRAGSTTIPYNTWKLIRGKEDFSTYIQSIITPAIGTKTIAQLVTNTDFYTRQKLINQGTALEDLLKTGEQAIAPVSQAQQLISGTKNLEDFLLGLVGISTPKTTPSTSNILNLIYERRPIIINEVKDLYSQGKIQQGNDKIAKFNEILIQNYVDAAKEEGSTASENELTQFFDKFLKTLNGKLITPPTQKQLQNFNVNQNLSNFQKLLK